jgi:hypothetical protein
MAVLARHRCWLFCVALVLGCASTATVREYLDQDTAATVTVASGEWLFARERTDLAMNARDYVTLTPVMNNRNGKRTYFIHCQIWSTIDRRNDNAIIADQAQLSLIANDRRIVLTASPQSARSLGFEKSPIELANSKAVVRWVIVDLATLRYIEQAQRLRITSTEEIDAFDIWRVDRAAIAAFLQRVDPK